MRKVPCNAIVASAITVFLGIALGMTGYSYVWPLFGAANQLLAALALLAIAAFLGNIGRNNKMFYVPMAFMLIVALATLVLAVKAKLSVILTTGAIDKLAAAGTPAWTTYAQLFLAVILLVLAIVLTVKTSMHIFGKKQVPTTQNRA